MNGILINGNRTETFDLMAKSVFGKLDTDEEPGSGLPLSRSRADEPGSGLRNRPAAGGLGVAKVGFTTFQLWLLLFSLYFPLINILYFSLASSGSRSNGSREGDPAEL